MTIDCPYPSHVGALRTLWRQAFGDPEEFLDLFFEAAFDPGRCRCVRENGQVTAALYWFDCRCRGQKLAYIYAVATERSHRGRGHCTRLMEDTHRFLKGGGYAGAVLVPGEPELFAMYRKMGYETCCGIRETACQAGEEPLALTRMDTAGFDLLRNFLLPKGAVEQPGENLRLLDALGEFYEAEGVCAWVTRLPDGSVSGELLGDASLAPGLVKGLGAKRGVFRAPGNDRAFAMYCPFTDDPAPAYFGLAFD